MGRFKRNLTANALILLMGLTSSVSAIQKIETVWTKYLGYEQVNSILQTSDGGYITTGCEESSDTHKNEVVINKLNASGGVEWTKSFGTPDKDAAGYSIEESSQGGYVVAGYYCKEAVGDEAFLMKISSGGNMEWIRMECGSKRSYSVAKSDDGGYLIAGYTKSETGDADVFVSKYSASGDKLWSHTYNASAWDAAFQIIPTSNGNFMLVGETKAYASTKEMDIFVMKINANGDAIWSKTYGYEGDESGYSIQNCSDGGYIVAGKTNSAGGYGQDDGAILKIDSLGNKLWEKRYGGACSDVIYSVRQDDDGGYILTGCTGSFGVAKSNIFILKIDPLGRQVWDKNAPGTVNIGSAVQKTKDGGFIVALNTPDKITEIAKLAYSGEEQPYIQGLYQPFTCVDSLDQIGFGGFKKIYWKINSFEGVLQSETPGNGANSKIMTPAFNICRDTGVVRVKFDAGFPTEYSFNWQEHNQLEVALCDDKQNELYTLQFKPNKPTDIGKTYDLKLFKDGSSLLASARTDRVTPHGTGAKMVNITMELWKSGQISVQYDAADGKGSLKYIDTPDNTYKVFKDLKLTYKTGTAGDGNNFITIDNISASEMKN